MTKKKPKSKPKKSAASSLRELALKGRKAKPKRKKATRKKDKRWPSYEQWASFARACWSEAQALAETSGDSEELFEGIGHQARHLGLECTWLPPREGKEGKEEADDDKDFLVPRYVGAGRPDSSPDPDPAHPGNADNGEAAP